MIPTFDFYDAIKCCLSVLHSFDFKKPLERFWDFQRVLETPRRNCYANTFGFPYSPGRFLIFHLQIDEGTGAKNNLARYPVEGGYLTQKVAKAGLQPRLLIRMGSGVGSEHLPDV